MGGRFRGRAHGYTYGWFLLLFDRKQQFCKNNYHSIKNKESGTHTHTHKIAGQLREEAGPCTDHIFLVPKVRRHPRAYMGRKCSLEAKGESCQGMFYPDTFSVGSILAKRYVCTRGRILKWSEGKVVQSCLTLCDPMDYTVHGILQAVLEWVAFPFSRGSSQPRNWTGISCIEGAFFTNRAIREALGGSWDRPDDCEPGKSEWLAKGNPEEIPHKSNSNY